MPHDHPHDHDRHPRDHDRAGGGQLHSHMEGPDRAEALRALAAEFVEGFRAAKDKVAYLRLAGVPLELPDGAGGPSLKLVDVRLTTEWQVGTASPSFGSRELSWLPFPGPMVRARENMGFVYVSLDARWICASSRAAARPRGTDPQAPYGHAARTGAMRTTFAAVDLRKQPARAIPACRLMEHA